MIIIKTKNEIDSMRKGGHILASIMDEIGCLIAPGISTLELDKLAEKLVFDNGGRPAFKGYGDRSNPYPATICASINNEIVHVIPSEKVIIKEGDIVKIDIGMEWQGMITDMARTFPAGKISVEAKKILDVTKECLDRGISKIRSGASLMEYSKAVEDYVSSSKFSSVRELVGHGVGKMLHEDPQIPNYTDWKQKIILQEGMTLALEPMINVGTHRIKLSVDGWAYLTEDGKLSAHFEDTVVVKKGGCEILTRK